MDLQLCGECRKLFFSTNELVYYVVSSFAYEVPLFICSPRNYITFYSHSYQKDGWVGDRCDIDLCDKFCDDTGTASCTKSPGGFTCNCADNYGGNYCQKDLCARCNDAGTSSCTGGPYEWTCNCAVSIDSCCLAHIKCFDSRLT